VELSLRLPFDGGRSWFIEPNAALRPDARLARIAITHCDPARTNEILWSPSPPRYSGAPLASPDSSLSDLFSYTGLALRLHLHDNGQSFDLGADAARTLFGHCRLPPVIHAVWLAQGLFTTASAPLTRPSDAPSSATNTDTSKTEQKDEHDPHDRVTASPGEPNDLAPSKPFIAATVVRGAEDNQIGTSLDGTPAQGEYFHAVLAAASARESPHGTTTTEVMARDSPHGTTTSEFETTTTTTSEFGTTTTTRGLANEKGKLCTPVDPTAHGAVSLPSVDSNLPPANVNWHVLA
jgi:hypothetical protein